MSRPGVTHERLVALFFLGILLFTPPFLDVFNNPVRIFEIPLLYLYLFAAWTLLIGLLVLVIETSAEERESAGAPPPRRGNAANDDTGL